MRNPGFGLYVHWPFCEAKCPYCDFNSHVRRHIDQDAWRQAYVQEVRRWADEINSRPLTSVYFGGGTPSLMDPETVGAILESAHAEWGFSNDIEITLEANPGSVEAKRFANYSAAGVNRVSLGVQALDDTDLRRLGRIHTVDEALSALEIAQNAFDRVSFDLICARQHQTPEDWHRELTRALSLGTNHLSLYQLTIEEGTAFGDRLDRGLLSGLPDEDTGVTFFDMTQELCGNAGLPAYEVSNHARPGQESRHNLIYWHGDDYVGIGPGAHGRVTRNGERYATETLLRPEDWLLSVGQKTNPFQNPMTPESRGEEYVMMGLRTTYGIDINRFRSLSGSQLDESAVRELCALGLLDQSGSILVATQSGRLVLNAMIARLLRA